MTKVFLTGATGVLGRRVTPLLVEAGHEVTAVARSPEKARRLSSLGARPAQIDLFHAAQVRTAVSGHDAICHLATHIPTGAGAAVPWGWRTNDRLRRDASALLASAGIESGVGRYVGESITFPYVDGGDRWIDESTPTTYSWGNRTVVDAEAAARSVTDAGGIGVSLRFAMFHTADSAHMALFRKMARLGISPLFGDTEGYISFIDVDDAAVAVAAALDVEPGVYNVAEAEPRTRAEHARALARAVGRRRLRPIPGWLVRAGGSPLDSLTRSHRVSIQALTDASGWKPRTEPITRWEAVA